MAERQIEDTRRPPMWRRFLDRVLSLGLLPILLVALFLFFGLYEPKFWRTSNLINVLRNSSYLMIIASGQMVVLIVGISLTAYIVSKLVGSHIGTIAAGVFGGLISSTA